MHVKLAKDYSLLISSHKVGKIVHALEGGRTMDPELRAAPRTPLVYRSALLCTPELGSSVCVCVSCVY